MNQENTYNITAHDLWTFVSEIQKAVQQGFVLSDKNEHFPQSFIGLYTCGMVLAVDTPVELPTEPSAAISGKEVTLSIPAENKPATEPAKQVTKRGRK